MNREMRIKLLMRGIRTYGEEFDSRAFVGIPVEKLIEEWNNFTENVRLLREKNPDDS